MLTQVESAFLANASGNLDGWNVADNGTVGDGILTFTAQQPR